MTSRIQTQRFATTGTRPANGTRTPGELWLNQPDFRLGMIDPTKAPVDLLPIRVYSSSAGYAQGDFVVNSGQLLQARTSLAPKAFAITDWNQFQSTAQTDARYLALSGGTLSGGLHAPWYHATNSTASYGAQGLYTMWNRVGDGLADFVNNRGLGLGGFAFIDSDGTNDIQLFSITRSAANFTVPLTFNGGPLPYLPIAGGNLTGQLGVGGNGIAYPSLGGYWAAHHVAIGWDGTQPEFAADGVGIGALAMQPWTVANFLSINGGIVHGSLTVNGRITWGNLGANAHAMEFGWDGAEIQAWVDGIYIGGLATQGFVGNYLPLSGGVISGTVRVGNGRLMSSNAGGNPSVTAWDTSGGTAVGFWDSGGDLFFGGMDGNGVPQTAWGYFGPGANLNVLGNLFVGPAASPNFQLTAGSNLYTLFFTNWALQFQAANGNLIWERYDGTVLFYCNNAGSLISHLDIDAGQNVNAAASVLAQAGVYAVNSAMGMFAGGSGRVIQFSPSWYFDWVGGNGDLHWSGPSGANFEFRVSDGNAGNNRGSVYGYGAYINLSDERAKTNVQPSPYGLPEILQLNPIVFERTNVVTVRREHGFSAQQVRPIIPEAVVAVTQDSDPLLGVTLDAIVAALVNTSKNFHQRLRVLEGDFHDPA